MKQQTKPILIAPLGSISPDKEQKLERAGYVVLQTASPEGIRIAHAGELPITGGMIALCALEAMQGTTSTAERERFTSNLYRELKKAEAQ